MSEALPSVIRNLEETHQIVHFVRHGDDVTSVDATSAAIRYRDCCSSCFVDLTVLVTTSQRDLLKKNNIKIEKNSFKPMFKHVQKLIFFPKHTTHKMSDDGPYSEENV